MRGTGNHNPPPYYEMQKCPKDNTHEYVAEQVRFYLKYGLTIHTEIAREISSQHQSSGWSGIPLEEFASGGFIGENLLECTRRQMHYWLYESDGIDGTVEDMLVAIRNLYALEGYIHKCTKESKD